VWVSEIWYAENTMTTLTLAGLIAVAGGAAIIAKGIVSTSDEALVTLGPKDTGAGSRLFAMLDDQRIDGSLGLSLIIFGSILLLLHFTGLALTRVSVTIIGFLVLIFLTAYARYAKHLRATQSERLTTLLARIVAAQGEEKALTSDATHG
jgi:hypothetical protein